MESNNPEKKFMETLADLFNGTEGFLAHRRVEVSANGEDKNVLHIALRATPEINKRMEGASLFVTFVDSLTDHIRPTQTAWDFGASYMVGESVTTDHYASIDHLVQKMPRLKNLESFTVQASFDMPRDQALDAAGRLDAQRRNIRTLCDCFASAATALNSLEVDILFRNASAVCVGLTERHALLARQLFPRDPALQEHLVLHAQASFFNVLKGKLTGQAPTLPAHAPIRAGHIVTLSLPLNHYKK